MCGGAGTRLWPASREVRPKQFLPLFGPRSTFQETLLRVSDPALFGRPIIITNTAYRFMVRDQLAEIGIEADVLLEPARRDSGPAIVAGAVFAEQREPGAVVLALAADHVVRDKDAFIAACRDGLAGVAEGRIVTFGVKPERPATEYGYISPGDAIVGKVRNVAKFVEKPDLATAEGYVAAGYLWNSGNFMFPAAALLEEYNAVDPDSVATITEAVTTAGRDLGFVTLPEASFGKAKPISIDYAVMEKTKRAAVVPVDCGWSDVGSWRAVWELTAKDGGGNAAQGPAVFEDSRNCHVPRRSWPASKAGLAIRLRCSKPRSSLNGAPPRSSRPGSARRRTVRSSASCIASSPPKRTSTSRCCRPNSRAGRKASAGC